MTSVYDHAHERRRTSAEGAGWFHVTAVNYPRVHDAFGTISHDGGWGAGHARYSVPAVWAPQLIEIERALSTLAGKGDEDSEFQSFCIGDVDEMDRLSKRSPSLTKAHALMEAFFEDFHDYVAEEPPIASPTAPGDNSSRE